MIDYKISPTPSLPKRGTVIIPPLAKRGTVIIPSLAKRGKIIIPPFPKGGKVIIPPFPKGGKVIIPPLAKGGKVIIPPLAKGGWGDLRKRNGFTLLEIIIVLTLVTLILGLSTIYFAGFLPAVKFNATGREISALIRHARSLARTKMETQKVIFDLDGKSYGFEGQEGKAIPSHALIMIADPVNGEIVHGKYRFVFHPSGGMEGGTIFLRGGKKKLRIDLDPITGAVVIRN